MCVCVCVCLLSSALCVRRPVSFPSPPHARRKSSYARNKSWCAFSRLSAKKFTSIPYLRKTRTEKGGGGERERKKFKDFRDTVISTIFIESSIKSFSYLSCITGDMSPRDAGGNMSGLYLSPYRGYEGNPGNNGGLSIPHRSKYNCSSNLVIENETFIIR